MNNRAIAFSAASILGFGILINAAPALAHHPNGGAIPNSFTAGFLSGIGHPVIGIDHLVFVVAIGLLAALGRKRGMIIPLLFVLATVAGTVIHLQSVSLPVPELIIAASVLVMGIFLARKDRVSLAIVTLVGIVAGIFHGYAYGESIIGAEATALGAYLLGFCLIQLGISAIAFYSGKMLARHSNSILILRFAGLAIAGVGCVFISNFILS